jgi:hypothetical protein
LSASLAVTLTRGAAALAKATHTLVVDVVTSPGWLVLEAATLALAMHLHNSASRTIALSRSPSRMSPQEVMGILRNGYVPGSEGERMFIAIHRVNRWLHNAGLDLPPPPSEEIVYIRRPALVFPRRARDKTILLGAEAPARVPFGR